MCGKLRRDGQTAVQRSRLGGRCAHQLLQHHLAHLGAADLLAARLHDVAGAVAGVQGGGDRGLQAVGHLGHTSRWTGVRADKVGR